MAIEDLSKVNAIDIREKIKRKELSASEVIEYFLNRISSIISLSIPA